MHYNLDLDFVSAVSILVGVSARGVLKAEPYLVIHSIDCLRQKVITQVFPIYSPRLNLVCFAHIYTPNRPRVSLDYLHHIAHICYHSQGLCASTFI